MKNFSELNVGDYFYTPKFGLMWRKIDNSHAVDVWSNRKIEFSPDVKVWV